MTIGKEIKRLRLEKGLTHILDYHGPEQGEEIHQGFTWGRAEGMVVTHWLEGMGMPDLEGVL